MDDPVLAVLFDTAESVAVSLVLAIDGMLISGTTASYAQFLAGVEDRMAWEGTQFTVRISQGLKDLRQSADLSVPPDTFYVRDATIWSAGQTWLAPWWAGRRSAISGWWFGEAKPPVQIGK